METPRTGLFNFDDNTLPTRTVSRIIKIERTMDMATFNVLMLFGIVVVLVAIKKTEQLNKSLGEQNFRDQEREDKMINCG